MTLLHVTCRGRMNGRDRKGKESMKSVLIKDTTKSERIAIIKEWIPVDDGLEDCEIDMWEMYREYINGEKEIAQINEEFSKRMWRKE